MKTRLFLAEDDSSIRQMLAFFLTRMCQCDIVGETCDGSDALRQCENLKPSAVIADLRMPGMSGVELLRELRRRQLDVGVIFYTGAMHAACMAEAMEAEPDGFVLKSDELSSLRQAVQAVSGGASFWSEGVARLRKKKSTFLQRFAMLTQSERDVLELIALGKTAKEIAAIRCKSGHTVAHQRQSIMDKLAVHNAVALAALVREAQVVECATAGQHSGAATRYGEAHCSAIARGPEFPIRESSTRF
jgi:DNA-binding NarL/FixJ family response regulator